MTTWHVHPDHLAAYAAGRLVGPVADSLEAHVLGCAGCRADLADRAAVPEDVWAAVVTGVEAPVPSRVERGLLRFGVAEHTARLLAATPSLRGAWLLAITATLLFAAVAARLVPGDRGFAIYLILAPLVPLVGVAAAYGSGSRGSGVLAELATAAPTPNERLLLLRAVAVLATSCAITAVAALIGVPHLGWVAVAWILPALALTSATLALATAVRLPVAATALGSGWLLVTGEAVRAAAAPLEMFGPLTQLSSLAIVLAGAAVVVRRHTAFDPGAVR